MNFKLKEFDLFKNNKMKRTMILRAFPFNFFKSRFELNKSISNPTLSIYSLKPENEIILDNFSLYINNKKVSNRNIDLSLYKDLKFCSNLFIRMYNINFLPGDEIKVSLLVSNDNDNFVTMDFKYTYLHDNEIFQDFS